jgi:hypothetical protein
LVIVAVVVAYVATMKLPQLGKPAGLPAAT